MLLSQEFAELSRLDCPPSSRSLLLEPCAWCRAVRIAWLVDLGRYTSGTHPNRKQPTQPYATNARQPAMPTQLTSTNATNALGHALRRRWRRFESCRGHTLESRCLLDYSGLV